MTVQRVSYLLCINLVVSVISACLIVVPKTSASPFTCPNEHIASYGSIQIGHVCMIVSHNGWMPWVREQSFVLEVCGSETAINTCTDSNGWIRFQTYIHAEDETQYHGADFRARATLYRRVGANWSKVDENEWYVSTTNEAVGGLADWWNLEVKDQLGPHEPYGLYKFELYASLGQSGPGYDEDSDVAVANVDNAGYLPYQQVVINDPIGTHALGETVHITGKIETTDHAGEPVSFTPVYIFVETEHGWDDSQSFETSTNGGGYWSIDYEIPYRLRYVGTATVYVDDLPKESGGWYQEDPAGCTTTFDIVATDIDWFEIAMTPIATKYVKQGNSVTYNVLITSIDFSGSITLSVQNLPSGAFGTFNPNPVYISTNQTSTSTLTITTSTNAPIGRHRLTLRGQNGGIISQYVCRLYVRSISVGGVWAPIDKFGLLAPYIGLASTIIVATVATAIYVKRVKRRKEKQ